MSLYEKNLNTLKIFLGRYGSVAHHYGWDSYSEPVGQVRITMDLGASTRESEVREEESLLFYPHSQNACHNTVVGKSTHYEYERASSGKLMVPE